MPGHRPTSYGILHRKYQDMRVLANRVNHRHALPPPPSAGLGWRSEEATEEHDEWASVRRQDAAWTQHTSEKKRRRDERVSYCPPHPAGCFPPTGPPQLQSLLPSQQQPCPASVNSRPPTRERQQVRHEQARREQEAEARWQAQHLKKLPEWDGRDQFERKLAEKANRKAKARIERPWSSGYGTKKDAEQQRLEELYEERQRAQEKLLQQSQEPKHSSHPAREGGRYGEKIKRKPMAGRPGPDDQCPSEQPASARAKHTKHRQPTVESAAGEEESRSTERPTERQNRHNQNKYTELTQDKPLPPVPNHVLDPERSLAEVQARQTSPDQESRSLKVKTSFKLPPRRGSHKAVFDCGCSHCKDARCETRCESQEVREPNEACREQRQRDRGRQSRRRQDHRSQAYRPMPPWNLQHDPWEGCSSSSTQSRWRGGLREPKRKETLEETPPRERKRDVAKKIWTWLQELKIAKARRDKWVETGQWYKTAKNGKKWEYWDALTTS